MASAICATSNRGHIELLCSLLIAKQLSRVVQYYADCGADLLVFFEPQRSRRSESRDGRNPAAAVRSLSLCKCTTATSSFFVKIFQWDADLRGCTRIDPYASVKIRVPLSGCRYGPRFGLRGSRILSRIRAAVYKLGDTGLSGNRGSSMNMKLVIALLIASVNTAAGQSIAAKGFEAWPVPIEQRIFAGTFARNGGPAELRLVGCRKSTSQASLRSGPIGTPACQ